jgi:hypothetical protein
VTRRPPLGPANALAAARRTLILASTILACSLVAAGAPASIRAPVLLSFLCLVPGLALTRFFESVSLVAEAALAIALSLAVTAVTGGLLLYLHLWSPQAVLAIVAAGTIILTLDDAGAGARARRALSSPAVTVHTAAASRRLPRPARYIRLRRRRAAAARVLHFVVVSRPSARQRVQHGWARSRRRHRKS